jgi:hypothetical protein
MQALRTAAALPRPVFPGFCGAQRTANRQTSARGGERVRLLNWIGRTRSRVLRRRAPHQGRLVQTNLVVEVERAALSTRAAKRLLARGRAARGAPPWLHVRQRPAADSSAGARRRAAQRAVGGRRLVARAASAGLKRASQRVCACCLHRNTPTLLQAATTQREGLDCCFTSSSPVGLGLFSS